MSHQITPELARELAARSVALALPGVGMASIKQTAAFLGIAEITIRTQLSNRCFPIRTVPFGRRRLVPVAGLVDFVADKLIGGDAAPPLTTIEPPAPPAAPSAAVTQSEPPRKRGPGRPSNEERRRAEKAARA